MNAKHFYVASPSKYHQVFANSLRANFLSTSPIQPELANTLEAVEVPLFIMLEVVFPVNLATLLF